MKRKSVRLEEQAMRKYRRTSPERGTKSRPNSSRGPPVPARSGARSLVDRSKGGVQRTCPSPPDSLLIETPGVSTCKSANVAALQTQKSISKTLALEVFDDIQIPDMTSEIPQKEKGKLNNMHAWMRIFLPLFGPQMLGGEFAKALERRIGLVVHLPRKREPKVKDIRWMECRNETWQQCDTIATVLRNSSYANIHLYWFRRGKRYCHANLVGIDHKNKTFELFEPNGYETWFAVHTTAIVENLRSLLPEYSYQALEFPKYGENHRGPQGYTHDQNCGYWCLLYIHLKCLNPTKSTERIFYGWWKGCIDRYGIHWKDHLREYMQRYRVWCKSVLPPLGMVKSTQSTETIDKRTGGALGTGLGFASKPNSLILSLKMDS